MNPNDPSVTIRGRNAKFYAAEYPAGYAVGAQRSFHQFCSVLERDRWIVAGPGRGQPGERKEVHPKNQILADAKEEGRIEEHGAGS